MKKLSLLGVCAISVLAWSSLCFGHACDDPWRPDPSNVGNPSGSAGPVIPAAPPAPPAPPAGGGGTGAIDNIAAVGPGGSVTGPQALTNQINPADGGEVSPDNIVLIPESAPKIIGDKGEFRMYVVNRSPRDLFAVKLEAISSVIETSVEPASLKRLVSGEKDLFTIKLKLKEKLKSGRFPMEFKVSSRGNVIYEGSLSKEKAEKENLCIRTANELVAIPAAGGSYDTFVKNNIFNEVNNVRMEINSGYFDIKIQPASVAKLKPGAEAKFTINLAPKRNLKPGVYDIRMHALTSSRNVLTSRIISIEVGKGAATKNGKAK